MEVFILFPCDDEIVEKGIKRIYLNKPGWCEQIQDDDIVSMFSCPTVYKTLIDDGISSKNIRIVKRPSEILSLQIFETPIKELLQSDEKKKIQILRRSLSLEYHELADLLVSEAFQKQEMEMIAFILSSLPPSRYLVTEELGNTLLKSFPKLVTFGKEKGKSTLFFKQPRRYPFETVKRNFQNTRESISFVLEQAILSKDLKMLGILVPYSPLRVKLSFPEKSYPEDFLSSLLQVVPYNSSYIPVLYSNKKYHSKILSDPVFLQSFDLYLEELSSLVIEKIADDVIRNDIVHLFKYIPLNLVREIPNSSKKIHEFIRLKALG